MNPNSKPSFVVVVVVVGASSGEVSPISTESLYWGRSGDGYVE